MRIEKYKAIDWYVDDPLEFIKTPGDIACRIETQGVGMSVFDEEGCFGCGGLLFGPDNTAEVWVRIAKRGLKHKKSGLKAIREGFKILVNICKDPMFCWTNTAWPEAQRLVSWLGFTKTEETLDFNDSTYVMWKYE